jgi:hypothetical protein
MESANVELANIELATSNYQGVFCAGYAIYEGDVCEGPAQQ